jgi:ATP-dependent DNA helicase RecG
VKADENDKKELFQIAGNIPFDDRTNNFAIVSDLRVNLIRDFLYEVKSNLYENIFDSPIEEIGRQMNIVEGAKENIKPKNIGLLMFNENPEKFFPMSQIEIIHFENRDYTSDFKEKIFKGPIHHQIKEVLSYISNYILEERIIKIDTKAESKRIYNYPFPAIEEAVVNSVYHKSYEVREPIEIRIEKERILIINYPGPDKSIKMQDIKNGKIIARRYRNRRIGEFLKELKLTEGRSTGIPKIIKSLKDNHSPAPIFITDEERSYFIVEIHINSLFKEEAQEEAQDIKIILTDTEKNILKLLKKHKLSKREIAEKLGYKGIPGNIKKSIKKLMENNIITQTIPEKPRSKYQKYKLINKKDTNKS